MGSFYSNCTPAETWTSLKPSSNRIISKTQTFKPREAEAGGSLWILGHPDLQSEFKDSQGYTKKCCLEKQKTNKKKRKDPSTGRQTQADLCEVEANLVYKASSRSPRYMMRPCFMSQNKINKKKKKDLNCLKKYNFDIVTECYLQRLY